MGQQLGPFGFVINSRVLPLGKEGEGGKGGKIYLSIPHELIVFSLNFFLLFWSGVSLFDR